jgi:hypothetical protein
MDEEKQIQEIKNSLELLALYEYFFGAISGYNYLNNKFPNVDPVKVSFSSLSHLSNNLELFKKVIERFSDLGVAIKIEGTECIIG